MHGTFAGSRFRDGHRGDGRRRRPGFVRIFDDDVRGCRADVPRAPESDGRSPALHALR
jgi:hypothetical protein